MKQQLNAQSGFGIFTVIAVIVVCAIGYVVWNHMGKNAFVEIVSIPEREECKKVYDNDICRFLTTWGKTGDKYRVTNTISRPQSTQEVDGKNVYAKTVSGSIVMETIIIDKDIYEKNQNDGIWYKRKLSEKELATTGEQTGSLFTYKNESSGVDVKYVNSGKEMCGALTCFKYTVISNAQGRQNTVDLFFDDKDYKLRKLVTGITVFSYDYDDGISVRVPTPVKAAGA